MLGTSTIRVALVTGASGFVGRALCARLKSSGVTVLALMRHRAEGPWDRVLLTDLATTAPQVEALSGIDTVFHLAGKAHALAELSAREDEYRWSGLCRTGQRDLP